MLPIQRDRWLNALLQTEHGREVISFAHGLPEASLFPLDEFRRSVDRVLRREGRVLLQLGSSSGYRPLQEYLCSQMALDGVNINPDELLITNGCQQSLDLIRRLLVAETDRSDGRRRLGRNDAQREMDRFALTGRAQPSQPPQDQRHSAAQRHVVAG